MNIETYISFLFSVLAIGGTCYTYFAHTKKLNAQQKQLNDYQLKQLKEEEEKKKKALIECNVIQNTNDIIGHLNEIQIINKGMATAYNIMLEVDKKKIMLMVSDQELPLPELRPGQTIEISYHKKAIDYHYRVDLTWDDEFKEKEKTTQFLRL